MLLSRFKSKRYTIRNNDQRAAICIEAKIIHMILPMVEEKTITQDDLETRTKFPTLYQVVILNDDYTPMEFVVNVLCTVFHMDEKTATNTMLQVHYQGKGVCGYYTRDVAETKVAQVIELARRDGHPLMCQVEDAPI